jgi:hypothetical protein
MASQADSGIRSPSVSFYWRIFAKFQPRQNSFDLYKDFSWENKNPPIRQIFKIFLKIFSESSDFYCKFQTGSQEYRRILYLFLLSFLVRSQIWLNLFCGWSALWLHHKVLKRRNPGLESRLRGQRASIGGAHKFKEDPNSQNKGILAPEALPRICTDSRDPGGTLLGKTCSDLLYWRKRSDVISPASGSSGNPTKSPLPKRSLASRLMLTVLQVFHIWRDFHSVWTSDFPWPGMRQISPVSNFCKQLMREKLQPFSVSILSSRWTGDHVKRIDTNLAWRQAGK